MITHKHDSTPPAVLSISGIAPRRIDGVGMLSYELSYALRAAGWRSVLAFPEKPTPKVARFLQSAGAAIIVDPAIFESGFAVTRAVFSLVRQTRCQQLNLSFLSPISLLGWAGRLAGARNVFLTDQGSRPHGVTAKPIPFPKRFFGRLLARAYTRVFCVSNYVRDDNSVRGYIPSDRLTTLYNATDFRRTADTNRGAEFRHRFGIASDKVLVAQVSWLIPEKGLDDLLRAAAIALAQNPNLHFLIAGDGASRPEYEQLSAHLGIKHSVTFSGLCEDPMEEGLYAAADITTQLSRWQEAFAWVIAEAMAHAKPVIGTRVGGIPEVIDDGLTGYLVPRADPVAAAQRILELSANPALRERMGVAGRAKAFTTFNLRDNVQTLLSAFGASTETVVRETAATVGA